MFHFRFINSRFASKRKNIRSYCSNFSVSLLRKKTKFFASYFPVSLLSEKITMLKIRSLSFLFFSNVLDSFTSVFILYRYTLHRFLKHCCVGKWQFILKIIIFQCIFSKALDPVPRMYALFFHRLSILERATDRECINNCSYSKKKCG
jgi:hypothetical protein